MIATLGDFTTSETIYFPFATYDSNGASVTITGLATTDIEVYKDGSTTQRSSDAGYALLDTDGTDFDGATGIHGFSVDLSDNTDAGFYANGSQFWCVVNAITVDSQTVRFVYYFTIGRELKPTAAGSTLDVTPTGAAGIDWANVENQSTAVDLSATDIQLADTVTTLTGHTAQTGDNYTRLGAPVGTSVSDDIATVDTVVDGIKAVTDNLPDSGALTTIDGNVDAILVDTGTTIPTTLGTPTDTDIATDIANVQSTVDNIGSVGGGAVNYAASTDNTGGAIKGASFVGSQTNTFSSTEATDGTYHQIDHTGNAIDIVYQFNIGGARTATASVWTGYLNSGNDDINIQLYDYVGADWETVGSITGQNGSTNKTETIVFLAKHTGTSGADLGIALCRFVTSGQTSPTFYTDSLILEAISTSQSVGYADGAIWVDTVNGTAGTEVNVNGTADNAVDTWADALTLSSSLNITRFHIINGSSITLTGNSDNYTLIGDAWTLALGGQSIAGAHFAGCSVSGTGTGAGYEFNKNTQIGTVTLAGGTFSGSGFSSTFTCSAAGDYFFNRCQSNVAGTGSPVWDSGAAVANVNLNFRGYEGGSEIQNLGQSGTDNMSFDATGQLIINANCIGGTIRIAGDIKITNNGSSTIDIESAINQTNILASITSDNTKFQGADIAAILVDTGTTIPATIGTPSDLGSGATLSDNNSDMSGATFSSATDSLEAVSNNVTSIQNNTNAHIDLPHVMEIPESGQNDYRVRIAIMDFDGNMEVPDSAPTIAAANQDGTTRDTNLSATTMSLVSTGLYEVDYTVNTSHAIEQISFTITVAEGSAPRTYVASSMVIDDNKTTIDDMYSALFTTHAESTGVPSATAGVLEKLELIVSRIRNATRTTASSTTITNDAGATIGTATLSNDGTNADKGEFS